MLKLTVKQQVNSHCCLQDLSYLSNYMSLNVFCCSGDGSKFTRKGTYKVKRGKTEDNKENNGDQMNVPSIRISKPCEY